MSPDRMARTEHPIEMISAYTDGRLEPADRERIHEHLGGCAACRQILADFRALAVAARREAAPPVPAYLLEKIGRRIDAESEARPALPLRFLPRARLPLATAAAILMVASLWIVLRGRLPGERLAEQRPDAAPPISDSSKEQPPSSKPESDSASQNSPEKTEPRPVQPGVAGRRADTTAFAPSPPASAPAVADSMAKKDRASPGAAVAEREESKLSAARPKEAAPVPEANLDRPNTAMAEALGAKDAEDPAPLAGLSGFAKAPVAPGTTLVLVMPEARVSVLPDLGVVLTAGDYICTLPAGAQEEVRALAQLRAYAAGQRRPARAGANEAQAARPDSQEGGAPQELVVPAPPTGGPLPPDAAAETHRRVWTILRDSLLARAEAQCGPAPPALHPEH
jgi:hypothetical protein